MKDTVSPWTDVKDSSWYIESPFLLLYISAYFESLLPKLSLWKKEPFSPEKKSWVIFISRYNNSYYFLNVYFTCCLFFFIKYCKRFILSVYDIWRTLNFRLYSEDSIWCLILITYHTLKKAHIFRDVPQTGEGYDRHEALKRINCEM